jgi:hypothetical protein
MKPKEIITLVVATVVIIGSIVAGYLLLFPKQKVATDQSKQSNSQMVPKNVDEKAYKSVSDLSDYGKPNLSGLGKNDLFGGAEAGTWSVTPTPTAAPAQTTAPQSEESTQPTEPVNNEVQ